MYTVWSEGRLLGESTLGYDCAIPTHRMGAFVATPAGEALMPIITGVSRAFLERARLERSRATGPVAELATVDADIAEAQVHLDSLHLELRGPGGQVISTESVSVTDCELLMRWADLPPVRHDLLDQLEMEASLAHDLELAEAIDHDTEMIEEMFADEERYSTDDSWRGDDAAAPRYQLHVQLNNEFDIPF